MWLSWLISQVGHLCASGEAIEIVCRTKDGREFKPFSLEREVRNGRMVVILCQNEEDED